jgi:cell division protein FtsI/penicillin-binding protein 2
MTDKQSPLLKKAERRNGRNGLRIPRKGRIRIVVLLTGAVLFYKFAVSGDGDAVKNQTAEKSSDPVDKTTVAVEKQKAVGTEKQEQKASKGPRIRLPFGGPRELSRDEVAELLADHRPNLRGVGDTLKSHGRQVALHYSIDTVVQKYAKRLFIRYHPMYGAAVAIHPETGRILALVSYTNPESEPIAHDLYNKCLFPAASVAKLVTAAGAVELGKLSSSSQIRAVGRNHTLYKSQLTPNPSRYREISLRDAFAFSINPTFGRLGIYILKPPGMQEYGDKFGFNAPIPFELPTETPVMNVADSNFAVAEIASGFNQRTLISPLFGALMASAVPTGGGMPVPFLVDSAVDVTTGENVYAAAPKLWRKPVSQNTAETLSDLMQSVARYGTARKSFRYIKSSRRFDDIEYGGKTGNVNKDGLGRVDWFVGFAHHPIDEKQRIAVGVVTVHGPYWTVHSSYLGAEIMRKHIRTIQINAEKTLQAEKEEKKKDPSAS